MNKFLIALSLLPLLFSCSSDKTELKEVTKIKKVKAEIPPEDRFDYDTLRGMYSGDFGGSEIRIILNYVSSSNVIGYNIHKGLQRNLNGKVTRNNDTVRMVLNEPGDHKFDGVFTLTFIGDDHKPTGKWEHKDGKIGSKKFKLTKMIRPEKDDSENITSYNFADYFGAVYDTLGSYTFGDDGLVSYKYYPKTDDVNRVEQLKEIRGSWNLKDSTLSIDWQPNKLFKTKQTKFTISNSEWGEKFLKGADSELYPYFW